MLQIIRKGQRNFEQEGHDRNGNFNKGMRELAHEQDQPDAGLRVSVQTAVTQANGAEGKILELAGQLSALQMDTKVGWAEMLDKIAVLYEMCSGLEQAQKSNADGWQVRVEGVCLK